jgi:hypothetical protein
MVVFISDLQARLLGLDLRKTLFQHVLGTGAIIVVVAGGTLGRGQGFLDVFEFLLHFRDTSLVVFLHELNEGFLEIGEIHLSTIDSCPFEHRGDNCLG